MATKTKAKPATERPTLPLPGAVVGFLNRRQVTEALGGMTVRNLNKMIARGDFPRPDVALGESAKMVRWSVESVNRWCHEKAEAGRRKAGVPA